MDVRGQLHTLTASPLPGKNVGTVGPRVGVGGFLVKITSVDLTAIRTPDRPVRSLVGIPTALLLLLLLLNNFILRALLSHIATAVT